MTEKSFITAAEMAEMLEISVSQAYKTIRMLNDELTEKGFLTIPGKIPKKYLEKRYYGLETEEKAG